MFTGIIESMGEIKRISQNGTNLTFFIQSPLSKDFKVDQSVSHNGVCLTVEAVNENEHQVTAIQETLSKTTLGSWKTGQKINLEQCIRWNGRLDGHIVQGHVDTTAECIGRKELKGSWEFQFGFPSQFATLIIEKGSICIEGISLTLFDISEDQFSVAIIPYTFHNTNLQQLTTGNHVNIEFDMVGKYVQRNRELMGR